MVPTANFHNLLLVECCLCIYNLVSSPHFWMLRRLHCLFIPQRSSPFQDLRYASEALNRLQHYVLLSSERGGIRIEYAKNKMGEVVSIWPAKAAGPPFVYFLSIVFLFSLSLTASLHPHVQSGINMTARWKIGYCKLSNYLSANKAWEILIKNWCGVVFGTRCILCLWRIVPFWLIWWWFCLMSRFLDWQLICRAPRWG